MWSFLWHAWRWSEAVTRSADAWSGQFVKGCQAILVSPAASMMLAALLLADYGGAWIWFRSLVPLWCFFVFAILVRPFAAVYPRIVLPLWLCLCGLFHPFPPGAALTSHRGLPHVHFCATMGSWCTVVRCEPARFFVPWWPPHPGVRCQGLLCWLVRAARDWWVLCGPRVTLVQWHNVWVSFASLLRYYVTLGSCCKVVRRELGTFYVPWWLSYPEVRCQGLLRWLAHAARTCGPESLDPCPDPAPWCASFRPCIDLCTWWMLRCLSSKSPCCFLMHDLSCTRAYLGMLLWPPWLCRGVVGKALASHRGLSCIWWVMLGLCVTHDPQLIVLLSLAFWMRFCATMGSWCMVVRCEPARFYAPWRLPHPGVRCQGPLRWLVRAARTYGLGSFGPRLGWGFSAQLWLLFPVAWCASFRSWAALSVLRCLSRKSPYCFLLLFLQGLLVQGFFNSYKSFFFSASRISHCRTSSLFQQRLSPFSFFSTFLYYLLYMAESLLAKLGDLNFTAEEQDDVVVVPETVAIPAEDFACSLVGRVLSFGPLDGGRVARLFRTIWKDDKVQTITEINPNFFLIAFVSSSHRDNVLKRGPWDFQKQWFALEPADPARTIHDYTFQYMCIWVRIHNIPLSLMTEALARTLGACIGKVVMTDTRLEDGNMGEFLRVRVSMDTTKPLRRCVMLSRPTAKAILCPLQYEHVPIFCHGCGLIGHVPKRPIVARPHGRVYVVKDADLPPLSPAPSVASSPPASVSTATTSVPAPTATDVAASVPASAASIGPATSVAPLAPGCDTTVSAPLPARSSHDNVHVACDNEVPYDPMLHRDVSDAMEDSLDVPNGCTLFSDLDGMVQSAGLDDVVDEVADALIHDVASSILGQVPASSATPATVVSIVAACRMGFKDLHLFNIDLLGKHLWRLLSEPGSLLYRTLLAKYFSDGDLLHASAPARSSFAWKGLHHALSRLRDGFFWTLGIDSQVRLFRDRWGGFSPVTLSGGSADNEEIPLRCREFMIPGQPLWDHSKLSASLTPVDVENIVEVPISSDRVDTLIWGDHDSGLLHCSLWLSLPSASFLSLRPPYAPLEDSSETPCSPEGLSDGACPLCGARLEETLHALRDCRDSSLALRQAGFADSLFRRIRPLLWTGLVLRRLSSPRDLWPCSSPSSGASGDVGIPGCMNVLSTPAPGRRSAISLCHDYASAFAPQTPPTDAAPTAVAPPRWRPPPTGSIKINVDGVFLPSAHLGAIGVLARDSSGAILGGFARPVPVVGPASAVEASTLLTGLEYAIALGWASALVESDAAVSVNKLHRPTPDLSLLGGLLASSRNLVAASRGCLLVGFAPRSANSSTHTLASWACQHNDVISFTSVYPELISRIVLDDLSSSF
ncbi:hypothetical protein GQ457_18G009190 [Hibiscus cannabinus]